MARPEVGLELRDMGVEQRYRACTARDIAPGDIASSSGDAGGHTWYSGVPLCMLALSHSCTSHHAMRESTHGTQGSPYAC
jgi:hypothetical protein